MPIRPYLPQPAANPLPVAGWLSSPACRLQRGRCLPRRLTSTRGDHWPLYRLAEHQAWRDIIPSAFGETTAAFDDSTRSILVVLAAWRLAGGLGASHCRISAAAPINIKRRGTSRNGVTRLITVAYRRTGWFICRGDAAIRRIRRYFIPLLYISRGDVRPAATRRRPTTGVCGIAHLSRLSNC